MQNTSYTVLEGNTLWGIANFFGVEVEDIVELNNLQEPELIYTGQVLMIPVSKPVPPRYYAVRPADTLYSIAKRYNMQVEDIAKLNNTANPNLIFPGQIIRLRT